MFVGKVIAMVIVNGGPGPTFLSPAIVDYLFGGMTAVKATVEDVLDVNVRAKITKVCAGFHVGNFSGGGSHQEYT